MPSVSKAQRRLMGADLDRARKGKKTKTGMPEERLEEYASTDEDDLPARKPQGRGHRGKFGPGRTTRTR